jgi:hypothetical protein
MHVYNMQASTPDDHCKQRPAIYSGFSEDSPLWMGDFLTIGGRTRCPLKKAEHFGQATWNECAYGYAGCLSSRLMASALK